VEKMSKSGLSERTIIIEQTDRHGHFHQTDYVSVKISFWHHQIPRASLTIIDGVHKKEEIDEIIMKVETLTENEASKRFECPRYISFICRAEDLLEFARKIIETHETESTC